MYKKVQLKTLEWEGGPTRETSCQLFNLTLASSSYKNSVAPYCIIYCSTLQKANTRLTPALGCTPVSYARRSKGKGVRPERRAVGRARTCLSDLSIRPFRYSSQTLIVHQDSRLLKLWRGEFEGLFQLCRGKLSVKEDLRSEDGRFGPSVRVGGSLRPVDSTISSFSPKN